MTEQVTLEVSKPERPTHRWNITEPVAIEAAGALVQFLCKFGYSQRFCWETLRTQTTTAKGLVYLHLIVDQLPEEQVTIDEWIDHGKCGSHHGHCKPVLISRELRQLARQCVEDHTSTEVRATVEELLLLARGKVVRAAS